METQEAKLETINYIEKASIAILALTFILFPVFFTNLTTDFFILPKQALLIFSSIALLILYGAKTVLTEKISIRRTPFDAAILLFLLSVFLSSIFSVARYDSLINFVPLLFAGISFFVITNNAKDEKSSLILTASLLIGGVLLSLISLFSYFKVYVFAFDFTKIQTFTTAGSILDQALYLLFLLPLGIYFVSPIFSGKKLGKALDSAKIIGFLAASFIILIGLIISIYYLIQPNAFALLPMETGFQTAFAAISQDTGRVFQGFLFGSGFGEFLTDFTRFKQASFNTNQLLWSVTFVRSSSFVLELLATTGLLGLLSFLFLCYKVVKEKPLFIPLIVALGASFILPFSFFVLTLIFFLLGIYSALMGLKNNQKYFDVELELVALKKGFFAFALEEKAKSRTNAKGLSYTIFAILLAFVGVFGFLSYNFLSANITFQKSIAAAQQNNGQLTYSYQSSALSTYTGKYVDAYYRVFSQTNLALANSLASSVPQGASPSAQTTQTIYTLVQQSINAARQATTLSPKNALDWQNLAGIYRSLIGFGQSADQFAVLAQQQATTLDPSNPNEFIALGGIYYQLQSWDNAQAQFQQAATLKPDFANAYYNLGHVLLQKGDLKGALTQFQTVKSLVSNDPTNLAKINAEIADLEKQIGAATAQTQTLPTSQVQQPLAVPTTQTLPRQRPPVKIPGPSETPTVTPTPTTGEQPSVTPTPTPTP